MDPQQARIKARYMRQQQDNMRLRRGSRWVALTLGATALSVYFYSMYTISQETVMREIDEEIENLSK